MLLWGAIQTPLRGPKQWWRHSLTNERCVGGCPFFQSSWRLTCSAGNRHQKNRQNIPPGEPCSYLNAEDKSEFQTVVCLKRVLCASVCNKAKLPICVNDHWGRQTKLTRAEARTKQLTPCHWVTAKSPCYRYIILAGVKSQTRLRFKSKAWKRNPSVMGLARPGQKLTDFSVESENR